MAEKKEKQKTKKNRILTWIFVVFNVLIIGWTAYSQFSGADSAADLADVQINGWLLLPALFLFIIGFGSELIKAIYMAKHYGDQPDWRVGSRTVMLGRYYDNITPAAVGGQPFQIHYMHTHDVKHGYDVMIPILCLISTQIAFVFVAIISFFSFGHLTNPGILGLGMVGLIFYAIFPISVAIATFYPKLLEKIISYCVSFLAKIKIVKDKELAKEKASKSINEYANCVRIIIKDKKTAFLILGLSAVFHICINALPYFIIRAFGGEISFLKCFVTLLAVTSTVYITPTPGNSGFAEGYFFTVFESLASGYVFWAMLFWRFFTYYVYIIMGPVVYALIAYEKKYNRYFFSDLWKKIKKFTNSLFQKSTKHNIL